MVAGGGIAPPSSPGYEPGGRLSQPAMENPPQAPSCWAGIDSPILAQVYPVVN